MRDFRKLMMAERLPKQPAGLSLLSEGEQADAGVIGGLSILGDKGYMCPTVTLITGDGQRIWGWSLCLGNPDQGSEELYFFDTDRRTHRGTEIPNTMVYFQAKIDPALLAENVDREMLKQVVAYVLPHISDNWPPPEE